VWIALNWLIWARYSNFGFHKIRGTSSLFGKPLAVQDSSAAWVWVCCTAPNRMVTEVAVAFYNIAATKYLTGTCEEAHKVSSVSTQNDQNVKRRPPLILTVADRTLSLLCTGQCVSSNTQPLPWASPTERAFSEQASNTRTLPFHITVPVAWVWLGSVRRPVPCFQQSGETALIPTAAALQSQHFAQQRNDTTWRPPNNAHGPANP
jgi:hypothetical protein